MAKLALPFLFILILCHAGKVTALAANMSITVVVYNNNSAKEKIHARVVDMNSSTGSVDYAVLADGIVEISFERNKRIALFFAARCIEDKEGRPKNCLSGNCPESGCTQINPPVAATVIFFNNGSFTISTEFGYNFGITGDFQCDCSCPSISCIIDINKCPLKILEESGSAVACMAGDGVPSCDDDTTAPSVGTSCFDNAIMKFTVNSPLKE